MKIFVGLSGGVDSAIAAYLLKKQGHDVTCGFMRNWDSIANGDFEGNATLSQDVCPQEQDYADAFAVAKKLDIPLLRVDFIKEYWDEVFQVFLKEYQAGRTPNPDILCNRYIKFDHFYQFAKKQGFDTVATGHYADRGTYQNQPVICKAKDLNKDQSYFLSGVKKEVVEHIQFPLGQIDKPMVRHIAEELQLNVAKKKDSTGICFIGERQFRQFLSNYLPMKNGPIINLVTKQVVGEHKGVLYYTIGQRKGLDIGGIGPFYVVDKDIYQNILYVVDEEHKDWLYATSCIVQDVNWFVDYEGEKHVQAKFRYRQPDQPVTIKKIDATSVEVIFDHPIAAITPGQQAVFYDGNHMLAGGQITARYQGGFELHQRILEMGKR